MDPLGALGDTLGRGLGGLPLWGWVALIGGAIVVVWVGRKYFGNKGSAASDGGSLGSGTANSALDPNIDPLTGTPYSIESAINPNTGLPAYYGGAGVTNQNAPAGGADFAQILAALQQIEANTSTQQNPSGPGGIGGNGGIGGITQRTVDLHGGCPPGNPQAGVTYVNMGTNCSFIEGANPMNGQVHGPVLSGTGGSGNPSDTSTGTPPPPPPPPPPPTPTPPPPEPPAYRVPGSTTTFTGVPQNESIRTPQPVATRGPNRYQ